MILQLGTAEGVFVANVEEISFVLRVCSSKILCTEKIRVGQSSGSTDIEKWHG